MFDLLAMIEHTGPSSIQGHYVFYIINNKRWYKMDDSLIGYTSDDNKYNYFRVYQMDLDEIL